MHVRIAARRRAVNVARAKAGFKTLDQYDQLFVHRFFREKELRGMQSAGDYANASWDHKRPRTDFYRVKSVILGLCGLDPLLTTKIGDSDGTATK